MRKPKITCFRYKRYNDVYVNNVTFSSDKLLSILDIFQDQKITVLIELDANYSKILSSIGENIGIAALKPHVNASNFTAVCNKTELIRLLNQVNIDYFEELFIATINKEIVLDEFMYSLEYTAGSLVKNGISDISIFIDFVENQMEISLVKEKCSVMSIRDKIHSIFKT